MTGDSIANMGIRWEYDDGGRADAGFRGDTGDCVTRAIAIATELDYRDVYNALNAVVAQAKADGVKRLNPRSSARLGVPRKLYEPFLADLGWRWVPTMGIGTGCRVHLRADELPAGRIIARLTRHVSAVVDSVVRDTYDPSREGTRCVYGYFEPGAPR